MTLEDLEDLFWNIFDKEVDKNGDNGNGERAGIAAVIRAVRDEANEYHTARAVVEMLNEILGDAGNEKVAGGSTREESGTDEKRGSKPLRKDGAEVSPRLPDPATDPCPRCGYPAQDQCDSPECNIDPAPADRKHPSHETRISFDASSYDEICVRCGATDRIGSWGRLAEPCSNPASAERSDATAVCVWTQKKDAPGFCSTPHGIAYRGVPFPECPSCGLPIKFTEAKT